jgi:hypothetical protein
MIGIERRENWEIGKELIRRIPGGVSIGICKEEEQI